MRNGTALYINTMDLIRRVRDTWRRDSEYSETQTLMLFSTLDLLVLAEVGAQYGTVCAKAAFGCPLIGRVIVEKKPHKHGSFKILRDPNIMQTTDFKRLDTWSA